MSGMSFSTDALAATPTTGATEYNGTALYFTPSGTQRGVVPGQQMFILQTAYTGTQATTAQSLFGLTNGVTLANSTIYAFEIDASLSKTAGSTAHTFSIGFGGTATINNIIWDARVNCFPGLLNYYSNTQNQQAVTANTASATVTTGSLGASGNTTWTGLIKGMISINAGGTFLPQYTLSAAPGGAYTTQPGSYMLIYPIGAAGANLSIGAWS